MRTLALVWLVLQSAAAPAAPRIVTLAPNMAELVFAAGAGEQLVGTVEYSDYPAEALDVPRIGDAFRVDYEALRRLQPDLIIAWASGTPTTVTEVLRAQGYAVEELDAVSLDEVGALLERIGELAGKSAVAAEAAAAYRSALRELREEYAGRAPLRVFYQISTGPWYTFGGTHVVTELIELCGGHNVFAGLPALAPQVDFESILQANPQVILSGSGNAGGSVARNWQQDWQRWDFVAAVRNGHLYAVNPDLVARSTPRLIAGGRQICEALAAARDD